MRNWRSAIGFLAFGAGLLLGGNIGTEVYSLGWPMLAIGVVLAILAGRGRKPEELGGPPVSAGPGSDGPGLPGLGTRVEQILRLAQDQAAEHDRESKSDAAKILAAAQAEADAILAKARAQAAGLTEVDNPTDTP